ncbi:peptide deformylase [Luteibaculum oceani]|uniref:Peptide deformylase n=1 Tax=Luteibaculum oceani TaxID=1294296 RepID=A0A5C6UUC4_9FLAO|nr:peptide deformylase [Luteibaculum oceani]TXC76972.1 peptide deformylase [Luteibaculum oceani]
MILPIVAYGHPVLKKEAEEIDQDYPNLKELIANMFETMYAANGVGLAAPQIGLGIRLFIVDASPFAEDPEEGDDPAEIELLKNFKKVFINPIIEEESGKEWPFAEGCLSIPDIREEVKRKPEVVISYYDENWELKEETYSGFAARVIQHEYDHVEGILFTDRIHPLKRNMLRGKLDDIAKGKIDVHYKMKFFTKKKGR